MNTTSYQKKLSAKEVIDLLNLTPLEPEGGFFRRTYESSADSGNMSCIYYLMTATSFSKFHVLRSDEIYHFYGGAPVELCMISPEGILTLVNIGNDLSKAVPQVFVPKGYWQASRIAASDDFEYSLLGTTVSPKFEFEDFQLADNKKLCALFPQHSSTILRFSGK